MILLFFYMLDGEEYSEYVKNQTETNKRKIHRVFEYEENVKMLSNYIKTKIPTISNGICHGTRRGKEQDWFSKYLNCDIFGTEISETATKFPKTIQWDFHNIKDEWINNFDFIYSNSLDHSYDIPYCLSQWSKCLKNNGMLIICGTTAHHPLASKLTADIGGYTKKSIKETLTNIPHMNVIDTINPKKKKLIYLSWYYVIAQKSI